MSDTIQSLPPSQQKCLLLSFCVFFAFLQPRTWLPTISISHLSIAPEGADALSQTQQDTNFACSQQNWRHSRLAPCHLMLGEQIRATPAHPASTPALLSLCLKDVPVQLRLASLSTQLGAGMIYRYWQLLYKIKYWYYAKDIISRCQKANSSSVPHWVSLLVCFDLSF